MTPPSPRPKPQGPNPPASSRAGLDFESLEAKVTRAAGSPLVRGGLTIVAGIVTGNILGFGRVALTAYLLGTGSEADSLAVAIGPIDTINAALINTILFAFVPMFTERGPSARAALFHKVNRIFLRYFVCVTAAVLAFAPLLIGALAPGLPEAFVPQAIMILRIGSLSSVAVGIAAVHSALLYTDRRFAPSVFHQATLNVFTILGAMTLWRVAGVYGFAIGYMTGAWAQLAMVYSAARPRLPAPAACDTGWRDIVVKPARILLYAVVLSLNITASRAYATHAGPGAAAALDYCMRCIGVPLSFLVTPMSNSLLPEIARLRSLGLMREALRLIDRTIGLAGLAAVTVAGVGLLVRKPVIALLFQRGSFTVESTELVAAVFLGFAASLVGWSLMELMARSLFALDRPSLPLAACAIPVLVNVAFLLSAGGPRPEFIGLGASVGFLFAFAALFAMVHLRRARWLA